MQTDYKTIASLLFPEGLLDYFDVENYAKEGETITFHISEKNLIPSEYTDKKLVSKGFKSPIKIEDFQPYI